VELEVEAVEDASSRDLPRETACQRDGLTGIGGRHERGGRLRAQRLLVPDDRETVRRLVDLGPRPDPRSLRARDAQPARVIDDRPAIAVSPGLPAHAAVVQPDAAIGIVQRLVVVADHERGGALLVHELADQGVDERR
jgi:hypothetical protein